MPNNPTSTQLHIDQPLTDYAIAYGTDLRSTYVAHRAATVKKVQKQSDKYFKWNKGDLFRRAMQKRAEGDRSVGSGQRLSNEAYYADVWALHTKLSDRQRKNANLDVDFTKTQYLMHQAKIATDSAFATACFGTSLWTGFTDQTGVASTSPGANQFTHWSDYSDGDPIGDITTQARNLALAAGMPGVELVGVCNDLVFTTIAEHPDCLDRIKHTAGVQRPASVTVEALASVLRLDELIVARGVENTAAEGLTPVMARLFGNGFLLLYRTPTPSDDAPTGATMFSWSEFDDVTPDGAAIFSWYENPERSTYWEVEAAFDAKITASDLGGFFASCIA